MLTIKDDSLRYYTISYAIFNQLSYLINSSGQMLSECVWWCVCLWVCRGVEDEGYFSWKGEKEKRIFLNIDVV